MENPIVGPHMEISLIYSPRLPQAFCPRLFVYRSQLLPREVSGAWQSLRTFPQLLGLAPSCPSPVTTRGEEKAGGHKKAPKGGSRAIALALTTQEALPPVQAREQPPAQPCLGDALGPLTGFSNKCLGDEPKEAREAATNSSLQGLQPIFCRYTVLFLASQ